jgi:hypothetical protein
MKSPKFIVDTVQRIEMVLSKNRSSLSTDDVFLLERCVFYFRKMRKAKSDQEKKEFLSKGISCWMKFFMKNDLLNESSELFGMLGKITE